MFIVRKRRIGLTFKTPSFQLFWGWSVALRSPAHVRVLALSRDQGVLVVSGYNASNADALIVVNISSSQDPFVVSVIEVVGSSVRDGPCDCSFPARRFR